MNNPIKETGLYCHIPFCSSTCDFCSFYQEKPKRSQLDHYLNGMDAEFSNLPRDVSFSTIFWGGGTPSLLSAKDLNRLGKSMLKNINSDFSEWTVEMAPSTVKADKLNVLLELGVTRFSLGVQSFNAKVLESLGRLHNPVQINIAWDLIALSGVNDTNIDLMFALPNQSLDLWEKDLIIADDLQSNHISTYCLTFEEDTALYLKLAEGNLKIDEERERLFYLNTWDILENFGFNQYEISNFSRGNNSTCKHNINTWKMNDWIGCGPSAASQFSDMRYRNPSSIDQWLKVLTHLGDLREDVTPLSQEMIFVDRILFGLRMNEGVHLNNLIKSYSINKNANNYRNYFNELENEEYVILKDGHYILTREGKLRSDAIGLSLMSI